MWSDAEDFKGIFIVRQALLDLPTTPERRKILADMETARFHATYLACMMSDADGFKAIDDRFGHDAGDGMLR